MYRNKMLNSFKLNDISIDEQIWIQFREKRLCRHMIPRGEHHYGQWLNNHYLYGHFEHKDEVDCGSKRWFCHQRNGSKGCL